MRFLAGGSLVLPRKLPEHKLITSIAHRQHRVLSSPLHHQICRLKRHLVSYSEIQSKHLSTYSFCWYRRRLSAGVETGDRCFHSCAASYCPAGGDVKSKSGNVGADGKPAKTSPTEANPDQNQDASEITPTKLSMFQRFKEMYKNYGYVLVPVHLVTSTVWFGSFYYASKSGVDVAGFLSSIGIGETITEKLRNSSAGHIAVAYALYKLATPARYTVTLGGTTYSIKWLSERGYIKPAPNKAEIRKMYEDKREQLREKVDDLRKRRREWRENFQKRRRKGWPRKH